jgi:dienelactone hydrolase
VGAIAGGLLLVVLAAGTATAAAAPATVRFPSADGRTTLVGYVFSPDRPGPHPALVLLHGRSGAYSSLAKGVYDATTLSQRHAAWARFWAERGYVALVVDSFGPRGHPAGFPRGSHADRPAEVSEQTVRPLDAYGALAYLRARGDVAGDRVGVQGWSNGAMTALVTMLEPPPAGGFRGALALYPGCGMERVQGRYVPYAPVLMLIASADEEVSPERCRELAARSRAAGGALELVVYEGAEHGFDDPGATRQGRGPNRWATEDARLRAERFFRDRLGK